MNINAGQIKLEGKYLLDKQSAFKYTAFVLNAVELGKRVPISCSNRKREMYGDW